MWRVNWQVQDTVRVKMFTGNLTILEIFFPKITVTVTVLKFR